MEAFSIAYRIDNKYEHWVKKADFRFLLIPAHTPSQQVLAEELSCSFEDTLHRSENYLGFSMLSCHIEEAFNEFSLQYKALVQVRKTNPFAVTPLPPAEEFAQLTNHSFTIDHHLFLAPTVLTCLPPGTQKQFPAYKGQMQVFDYAFQLTQHLHTMLEYCPESTDVDTSIAEVLRIRKGVCQDFAHLFIGICRANRIPARYVSGYLNQGEGFTGDSQLHAWAEVFIPNVGWKGFDATNNLVADHHFIKIAHGTDYRDCSPIVGVLANSGMQKSTHSVTVTNQ